MNLPIIPVQVGIDDINRLWKESPTTSTPLVAGMSVIKSSAILDPHAGYIMHDPFDGTPILVVADHVTYQAERNQK